MVRDTDDREREREIETNFKPVEPCTSFEIVIVKF